MFLIKVINLIVLWFVGSRPTCAAYMKKKNNPVENNKTNLFMEWFQSAWLLMPTLMCFYSFYKKNVCKFHRCVDSTV